MATLQGLVTSLTVLNNDHAVGDIYQEVGQGVGQQLFVHQFVDGPFPLTHNFEENTKIPGIGNITGVRDSHAPVALSESEDEITENNAVFLNISGIAFIAMTMILQYTTLHVG